MLTPQQAAAVKSYNDSIADGVRSHTKLRKELKGAGSEIEKFARKSGYAKIPLKEVNGQFVACSSGLKGLGTTLKLVGKELVSFGIQFAAITAAAWAVSKAVEFLTNAWKNNVRTLKNVKQWAEDATTELNETRSKIEDINGELETTASRISELKSKGSLSFTEQAELDRLTKQNELLSQQLKIQQSLAKIQAEDASKKNLDAATMLFARTDNDEQRYITAKAKYDAAYNEYSTADPESADFKAIERRMDAAKTQLDSAKSKYEASINESVDFLINVDPSTLVGKNLDVYNQHLKSINQDLLHLGTITKDEYLTNVLSDSEYQKMTEQMQNLASTGQDVGEDILSKFSITVQQAWIDAEGGVDEAASAIQEHINSLRSTGDVVSNIISGNSNFSDIQNIIDEITSSDFEITTDSITDAVGQDFVTALDKAGISIGDFCNWLSAMQDAGSEVSIKDAAVELATVEEKLNSLSDAYNEFADNSGKVAASTLKELSEGFADIADTDEFEKFITQLGNANTPLTDLKDSLSDVVSVYFQQKVALGELTEEYKGLYIAQLKQLGVTNAQDVVEAELALTRLKNGEATAEETYEIWKKVAALKGEENSALDTALALEIMSVYEALAAGSNFADVMDDHAESILGLAEAAGISTPALQELISIMADIDYYNAEMAKARESGDVGAMRGIASQISHLNRRANDLRTSVEQNLANALNSQEHIEFKAPPKDKSGGGDKDPDKEAYDKAKAKLDNQLERNKISYEEYYKELVKLGNKYFKGDAENMREHYATLADVRRDAYAKYQGDLDKDLANGVISLQTYYDKSKALSKEWLDGRKANEEDYKEAVEAIYDAVNDAWGDRISQMETRLERMTLDKNWEPGKTEADYWNKMLEELEQDYINGLFDSTDEYYDHRYDLLKKLDEAKKESWENELDAIQESKDSIQDLIDLVSDMMKHELEEQIDALEKQKDLYSEIVDEKKKSLDLTREENEYQKQLEEYNRDLTELQAKAAVLALDDSREGKAQYAAIMEQIREKQNEIQSSQSDHTYDATTEALDAAQSAYEEKIEKQVSDIQALMEEAGPWLERVYERIEQTPPSKLLADLTRYNYYHGTGMDSDVQRIWAASEGLLTSFDSNVLKILAYLETQEKTLQAQIDASGSDSGSDLSDNYVSDLNKKVQASVTRNQSDATNMGLLDDVRAQYGSGWYDTQNKVIYLGEDGDRRVSAGAANLIQQMESVKNSKAKKSEKEKQLNELLTKLKRKWGYGDAHIEWDGSTPHLYKTAGKSEKWQIFHDGYTRGYVGQSNATYTPDAKQRELLALLEAGELVVNKTQQGYLLSQLQTLQTLSDGLRKLQLDSVPGDTYGIGEINIEVNAPITIEGNANADTIKELEKFKKNLSNDVLGEVTSAMKRKGYGRNTAVNARKK